MRVSLFLKHGGDDSRDNRIVYLSPLSSVYVPAADILSFDYLQPWDIDFMAHAFATADR